MSSSQESWEEIDAIRSASHIYVIAGTYSEYDLFVKSCRFHPSKFTYVVSPAKVLGHPQDITVTRVGTWYLTKDSILVDQWMQDRGARFVKALNVQAAALAS